MAEASWFSLLSGGALVAIITAAGTAYTTSLKSDDQNRATLIKRLIDEDNSPTGGVPRTGFRTVLATGAVGDKAYREMQAMARLYPSALPRFYHSGYIYSAFYKDIPAIKAAYRTLGLMSATEEPPHLNGRVTGEFILATMRLQLATGANGRSADGIFGHGVLRRLEDHAAKNCLKLSLSDHRSGGSRMPDCTPSVSKE